MAVSKQMAHPPLVEALCEVAFAPASPWDWTIPGRLYERLAKQFPETVSLPSIGFTTEIARGAQPPVVLQAHPDRVQFKRADGAGLVQIAPQLLAINRLPPYPGWEGFSATITSVFKAFTAVAPDAAPARLGLRYINRIGLQDGSLSEIRSALTYAPQIGAQAAARFSSFYQRYEFTFEDPKGTLVHQTAKQTAPDGASDLILDLDFQSAPDATPPLTAADATRAWLDAAHAQIEQAFLESLTAERLSMMRGA